MLLAPAIIDPGDNTTTEVSDGRTEYFQINCDGFSTHVLVELSDVRGTSFIYASATVKNPSSRTENTASNTTTGITRRTAIVNIGNIKVMYIKLKIICKVILSSDHFLLKLYVHVMLEIILMCTKMFESKTFIFSASLCCCPRPDYL